MKSGTIACTSALALSMMAFGCHGKDGASNDNAGAPPPAAPMESTGANNLVKVDKPSQFTLATVQSQTTYASLDVTGQVQPDVSREVPVLSIANGRVTALHVGLGDFVHKGQLVMEVQSPDVTTAFDAYLKAVNDEHLTNVTYTRDKLLFDKGAIAKSQLDVAEDGENDAKTDLKAAEQQLRILGVDKDHPGDTVKVYAPISGVVTAQNTTTAGAAGLTATGAAGSLTIADLSHVWVVCDVYENTLSQVHLGEQADINLNAFPGKTRKGTISDIGAILDPSLRTAKVRIQVPNPDNMLRIGMFATATFHSSKPMTAMTVPASAILQLHDKSFVFVPGSQQGTFRRVAVTTGRTLEGNLVEVLSGLSNGQQVVLNALELQNTADQE